MGALVYSRHQIHEKELRLVKKKSPPGAASERDIFGKRRDILDGARKAFARGGYSGTSIDDIVLEAGVSKRTVYQHFSGKEDLFGEIIREQCDKLVAPLRFWPSDSDPKKVLTDFGENLIQTVLSDEGLDVYRLVIAETKRFPELGRAFYESGHGTSAPILARYLAEQTRAGTLSVENPEEAADLFFAMISATLRMKYLTGIVEKLSPRQHHDWVQSVVRFFLASCGYRLTNSRARR